MEGQKPVRKPTRRSGCENCNYKGSDFFDDAEDPKVIRVYCKARFVNVNAIQERNIKASKPHITDNYQFQLIIIIFHPFCERPTLILSSMML